MLTEELVASIAPYSFPPRAAKYIQYMMDYNVPHGKLTRGITVIHTLRSLRGGSLTSTEFRRAAVLGWCVEWLQAMFLVMDDIMDESETRRGQPCWCATASFAPIAPRTPWSVVPSTRASGLSRHGAVNRIGRPTTWHAWAPPRRAASKPTASSYTAGT